MKTTLVIHDDVVKRLCKEAARRDTNISELVEAALRLMLEPRQGAQSEITPLPVFDLGGAYIDIAGRDVLYRAMEGR
jgi:hypothetical protein